MMERLTRKHNWNEQYTQDKTIQIDKFRTENCATLNSLKDEQAKGAALR